MKKLVSVLILSALASIANAKVVGSAQSVVDAQNFRIVNFQKTKVDSGQIKTEKNPFYPCGNELGSNCGSEYITTPIKIEGYDLVVAFDSAKNGDTAQSGNDSVAQSNQGYRVITMRASDIAPLTSFPKKRKDRVALANTLFSIAPQSSYVIHHEGVNYPVSNNDFVVIGQQWSGPYDTVTYSFKVLSR